MDLKAEARRLVEEAIANCNGDPNLTWYSALESALLAFGRLVREEDAKICDKKARSYFQIGADNRDGSGLVGQESCLECALSIRQRLKSLE